MPTDEEVAEALCAIFQALEKLHAAGLKDARASKVRREAVHFLWELREGDKLAEHRPHSQTAWDYRQRGLKDSLRYEHSIPLALLMPLLRAASGDSKVMLLALERYVRPVIVTEEEARLLSSSGLSHRAPEGEDWADPDARYRAVGIVVRDGQGGQK